MRNARNRNDRVALGMARVCEHQAEIRAQLAHSGSTQAIDDLLAAVRAGRDVGNLLDALHMALQTGGDALGVYGHTRGTGAQLAGISGGRPSEEIYLCPGRRCTRYCWPDATVAGSPTCEIDGAPMLKSKV
ncbi:hypothetical protein [Streptomyces sp. JHA19]|uniref:hypothetical protein n=1 Tax=Streptomyces sp. JHA19 TaxID=1577588 RepID=UPI00131A78EB|nr:hypothetical protein [Streptomyces sp. JHA19]